MWVGGHKLSGRPGYKLWRILVQCVCVGGWGVRGIKYHVPICVYYVPVCEYHLCVVAGVWGVGEGARDVGGRPWVEAQHHVIIKAV